MTPEELKNWEQWVSDQFEHWKETCVTRKQICYFFDVFVFIVNMAIILTHKEHASSAFVIGLLLVNTHLCFLSHGVAIKEVDESLIIGRIPTREEAKVNNYALKRRVFNAVIEIFNYLLLISTIIVLLRNG